MKLTQTTGPTLEGQKPKGRKSSTLKPGKRRPQTQYIKKKMKKQRNTTQMKEQTRNTKIQTQSSADRITTSLSLVLSKKKQRKQRNKQKLSTNLTLCKAHTNHWTNLRTAEIKRKKEFNLEAWERRPQTHKLKENNTKPEKYYTNEGTN